MGIMKYFLPVAASFLFLTGCATPADQMTNLSIGMTKAEVIAKMGQPTTTSMQNNTEYLSYLTCGRLLACAGI